MRTLAESDVKEVASVAAELATLDHAEPFPVATLARLATLVGSRDATYTELDRGQESFLYEAWWEDGVGGSGRPETDRRTDTLWWQLRHQHPIRAYREQTDDWTSTRLMSDFVTTREFRRTEIWNELYRDQRSNHWIGVGLSHSPTTQTRMFMFTRERLDFRERDRLVLDLLQPHLQRRYERAKAASEAADAFATLAEQDDDTGRLIICSQGGTIEFASKQARRILGKYFDRAAGRLPPRVYSSLYRGDSVTVTRGHQRLTLRSTSSAGLLVVVLSEEDLRLKRLTPRQRTILDQVATGATNAQIAANLEISPATVNKHLEQIYRRLDIHSRTAAAAFLTS